MNHVALYLFCLQPLIVSMGLSSCGNESGDDGTSSNEAKTSWTRPTYQDDVLTQASEVKNMFKNYKKHEKRFANCIFFDHLSIQFQEESVSGMAARRCSLGMEDRRGHEEAIRRFLRRIEDSAPDEPDGQGKTDSLYSPQYEPCLFFTSREAAGQGEV